MTNRWSAQQQHPRTSTIPQEITESLSQMGYLPLRMLRQSHPSNVLVLCTTKGTITHVVVKSIKRKPGSPCAELSAMMRLHQATPTTTNSNSISNKAIGHSRRHSTAHPHVIELLEAFEDGIRVYLVFPWLEGGDLLDTIVGGARQGGLSGQDTHTYFRHMVEGLRYLKHHGIAHGDVSPENVVLSGAEAVPPRAVLIDLGSSKIVKAADGVMHDYRYAGKLGYVPPEIVHGRPQPQQQQQQQQQAHAACNGNSVVCPFPCSSCTSPLTSSSPPWSPATTPSSSSQAAVLPPSSCCSTSAAAVASSSVAASSSSVAAASPSSSSSTLSTIAAAAACSQPPAPPAAVPKPLSPYCPLHDVDAHAVDVWALGACLFGMLTGRQMYLDPGDIAFTWLATGRVDDLLVALARHHGIALPSDAHDLICQMMRPHPADRVTLEQVFLHPWVARTDTERDHERRRSSFLPSGAGTIMTMPCDKEESHTVIPRVLAQPLSMMGYVPLHVLTQSQPKNVLVICTRRGSHELVVVKCISRRPGSRCAELSAMLRLRQANTSTTISSNNNHSNSNNKNTTRSHRHSTACPHVVELLDAFEDEGHGYLVMPWLEGGDLLDRIVGGPSGGGLSIQETRTYFRHMVEGLLYLKNHGIAHGDVTPENVVLSGCSLDMPRRAVLIDLGSSQVVDVANGWVHDYRYAGKLGYVPPEIVHARYQQQQQQRGQPARGSCNRSSVACSSSCAPSPSSSSSSAASSSSSTPPPSNQPAQPSAAAAGFNAYAVDVWALGACLFGMLTGRQLYLDPGDLAFKWLATGNVRALLDAHGRHHGIAVPPEGHNLISMMMRPDPTERVTLEEILLHPWVAGGGTAEDPQGVVRGREASTPN